MQLAESKVTIWNKITFLISDGSIHVRNETNFDYKTLKSKR